MAKALYSTITGLTDTSIKTQDGKLLVLPTAAGGVLNPGIKDQEITAMSRIGEMVIVDTYPVERKPEIKLDWNQKNVQLLSMRLGLQFSTQTAVAAKYVNSGLLITKGSYAAALVGFEGNGVTADQAGTVAYSLGPDQIAVALTRMPFASFVATGPLTYAQGADGAMLFSTDLIGQYVAFEVPQTLASVTALSDQANGTFAMTLMTIMQDRSILQWDFPSVAVKKDQGDINLSEPKMEITFYIQYDGSTCLPYQITYKGQAQKRTCKS